MLGYSSASYQVVVSAASNKTIVQFALMFYLYGSVDKKECIVIFSLVLFRRSFGEFVVNEIISMYK